MGVTFLLIALFLSGDIIESPCSHIHSIPYEVIEAKDRNFIELSRILKEDPNEALNTNEHAEVTSIVQGVPIPCIEMTLEMILKSEFTIDDLCNHRIWGYSFPVTVNHIVTGLMGFIIDTPIRYGGYMLDHHKIFRIIENNFEAVPWLKESQIIRIMVPSSTNNGNNPDVITVYVGQKDVLVAFTSNWWSISPRIDRMKLISVDEAKNTIRGLLN